MEFLREEGVSGDKTNRSLSPYHVSNFIEKVQHIAKQNGVDACYDGGSTFSVVKRSLKRFLKRKGFLKPQNRRNIGIFCFLMC